MDKSKLGDVFSMCTLMMHDAVTDFYENIHDDKGVPISSVDDVSKKASALKSRLLNEVQMVVDMTLEYGESHAR
tara:strand:+ start:554 stop:775 length:222 start_codon:yes stop_codon:yes gene_type:complete